MLLVAAPFAASSDWKGDMTAKSEPKNFGRTDRKRTRALDYAYDLHLDGDGSLVAMKFVLVTIAYRADPMGIAFPSIKRLARECQMSERYVKKLVRKLEDQGHIERVKVQRGERWVSGFRLCGFAAPNVYKFSGSSVTAKRDTVNHSSLRGELQFPHGVNPSSHESTGELHELNRGECPKGHSPLNSEIEFDTEDDEIPF